MGSTFSLSSLSDSNEAALRFTGDAMAGIVRDVI
jgi:hypothetical protein